MRRSNQKPLFISLIVTLLINAVLLGTPHISFAQTSETTSNILPLPTARPGEGSDGFLPFEPAKKDEIEFPDEDVKLSLKATLKKANEVIEKGMVWRVYQDREDEKGKLPLLATFSGGPVELKLPAGFYFIHGSYGYTGETKRIKVLPPEMEATFNISAGGLRLNAAFREGDIIPANDVKFEISQLEGGQIKTIVTDVAADELIRLSPGQYQVTSRYGNINSEVSANIEITDGELTEVTLYQRGAEITLKLVSERGGEALANTSWTVLTPAGDPVVSSIKSAFPTFILAAGDYVAFARHDEQNYSEKFTIESGVHRDVEVILTPQ